jgi:uncharacterized damage-inducible protein DinB
MDAFEQRFIKSCIQLMREHYLPKIKEAVALCSEFEIWETDGETTNSIGHLLLHLTGNVRQHVVSGIGEAPDERLRHEEFKPKHQPHKDELLKNLEATVNEACAVLEKMNPELLHVERTIQNNKVLISEDLFHVAEHFGYHAGQIIYIVKWRKEHHFHWYAHLEPKF